MPTETGRANRMGATFAERKAAREGVEFEPAPVAETGNSTFAERTGKPLRKAVDADDASVEDKAIARKKTTRKKA